MEILQPDARKAALLSRFERAGGVLEFVQVTLPGEEPSQAAHAAAVCAAMHELRRKATAFGASLAAQGRITAEAVSRYAFAFDCAGLAGRPIGLREFLGAQYALERGRCILRGRDPHLNRWFVVGDEQSKQGAVRFGGAGLPPDHGLVYAFAEPPYNLQLSAEETDALFHEIVQAYLGGLDERLEIFAWPADWSAYFDDGREWWGTFLWSVYRPGESHITVILGSATD
ncbi:MAG TPA: hypothetical protein VGN52_04195 [Burkholderiales bacterium]